MKPVVGVIGLGIMGGAMAEALLAAGYRVCGYDIRPQPRQRLKRAGGRPLASAAAVARSADLVIVSLATVRALDAVAAELANAALTTKTAARRSVVIETSTLPIADKERAAKLLAKAGMRTLDCPISGTAVRMKEGAWTIFVSGDAASARKAREILRCSRATRPTSAPSATARA